MLEQELREELKQEFVERFNFYVGYKGLKFRDIAERLSITKQQISQFRCGRGLPTVTMIHVLAQAIGVEPINLFPQGREAWEAERIDLTIGSQD